MKKYLIFSIFPAFLFSAVSDAGTYFLLFFCGARAVGMGAAFTAIPGDLNSSYYNPGGLSFIKNSEIIFDYSRWDTDVWPEEYYFSIGFVKPLGKKGIFSGNMIYSGFSKNIEWLIEFKNTFLSRTLKGNFCSFFGLRIQT